MLPEHQTLSLKRPCDVSWCSEEQEGPGKPLAGSQHGREVSLGLGDGEICLAGVAVKASGRASPLRVREKGRECSTAPLGSSGRVH